MQHLTSFLTSTALVLASAMPAQVAFAQSVGAVAGSPMGPNALGEPSQRGWFLTGRVMMDDGSTPPESITILRNCGGVSSPVAYTNSKGRFSFQLGGHQGDVVPDASSNNGEQARISLMAPLGVSTREGRLFGSPGGHQLNGCDLEASLPGYRSDSLDLSGQRYMDNPDIGTLVLHRLGTVEGTSISATGYEAPGGAKKAYQKGLEAAKKQKWPEAQAQFQKAVQTYPRYAAAWFDLGTAYEHQGKSQKAREAFLRSVAADSRFMKPYFPLAAMAFAEKNWKETADLTATLIRLDPVDYPAAFLFNAVANAMLGNLDVAENSARDAIRLDENHHLPRAEYVLGYILAERHEYAAALPLLKSYIQRSPDAPDAEKVKKQINQIETLAAAQPATAPEPQH
jgi:tetratricopeptide (TPR) repeat protein